MPVLLERRRGVLTRSERDEQRHADVIAADADCLEIGLVNNMPDAALRSTERQFIALLAAAAGDRPVRVRLFCFPSVARGPEGAAHVARTYRSIDTLGRSRLDALIVTGCEPRAASLADEPFWADLTALVGWAEHNTVSTLWSCLAAHAAVLHLDGVARHPMTSKRSGLYECEVVAAHPLLDGVAPRLSVPHSRWNDLREAELEAHGYRVLTRSPEAGVDLFVKRLDSLFVFFQGHPEYEADSIPREYRRDLARYLRGERPDYPILPHAIFDDATEAALMAFRTLALADPQAAALRDLPRPLGLRPGLAETWQRSVVPVFRNWLALVAAGRQVRAAAA